jgi:hypothetical protein
MRSITSVILSLVAGSAAGEISLTLPIDCTLGDDCYIQQVVDQDPSDGIKDFQCGRLTYDGHKGTDFALPSLAAVERGVAVLAAAQGEIRAVRDSMADILQGASSAPDVGGKECGNGVVIRLENGWETQYCHMAQGSIAVSVGDQVEAGDTLGFVGLSGQTEFPHLHLSLRWRGEIVDPFDPDMKNLCDAPTQALWDDTIAVPAGGLISAGFAPAVPEYEAIKAGEAAATTLPTNAPALVVWGYGFGTQTGDLIDLEITGPDGVIFETEQEMTSNQAQMFRAGGRRTPDGGWPLGDYIGEVKHLRDGDIIDQQTTSVTIVGN